MSLVKDYLINIMCKAVEEYGKKERMKGRQEGRLELMIEFIKRFIQKGKSYDEIADELGVSVDEVERIAASMA